MNSLLTKLHQHGMDKPIDALDALAEAYNCPDVAMSETVEVIQLNAAIAMGKLCAEIVDEKRNKHWHGKDETQWEIKKAILSTINQLEENQTK